jgi:hypothetical protein
MRTFVWLQVINLLNSKETEDVDLLLLIDMLKSIEGINCQPQHMMNFQSKANPLL